jgi:DNA polymerase III alpha subunit
VRWIFDHFGHDRVALISTHITLQARQAIREAGKAMGIAESEVNRFTRPIPGWIGEGRALAELPVVFPECRDLPIDDEPWRTVLAHAQRLIDFPRNLSIHCGGLLISPDPITDHTPLQRAAKGPIITQMEMHAIEDLGLIKIDILSNRSLGVFDDCLRVLSERRNEQDHEGGEGQDITPMALSTHEQ